MTPLYLHGRGLACASGMGLPASLQALRSAPPAAQRMAIGGLAYAYRPIPASGLPAEDAPEAWQARCAALVQRVGAESGASGDEALILASSSFDMGRLERGGHWLGDGLSFAAEVATAMGWRGPVYTVNTACTSAFNGLRLAADLLDEPGLPGALVVGLECHNRFSLAGFAAMQLIGPVDSAVHTPPSGLVLGEGVAALRLGREPARWRLAGSGHVVCGTDPGGATATALDDAIALALEDAGLDATDIGLVRRHATGGAQSDGVEDEVLARHLPHAPPSVGLKPWCGHTQGASAAVELALLTAAIEQALPLHGAMVPWPRARHVLALGLGFGGGHAALVLEDGDAR